MLQFLTGGGLVLQQQRCLPVDGKIPDHRWGVGEGLAHPQRGGVHEFEGRSAGRHQRRQRLVGRIQVVEDHEGCVDEVAQRDRAVGGRGDEGERALAADDQVGEDLWHRVEVDQRVDAVAHGVLHRELLGDLRHGRRVPDHPLAELQETLVERRLEGAQLRVRVGRAGVDDGA